MFQCHYFATQAVPCDPSADQSTHPHLFFIDFLRQFMRTQVAASGTMHDIRSIPHLLFHRVFFPMLNTPRAQWPNPHAEFLAFPTGEGGGYRG